VQLHKYAALHSSQAVDCRNRIFHRFSSFSAIPELACGLLRLWQVNDDCRPPDLLKPTQAEVQGQLEATFPEAAWCSRRDVVPQGMARASLFSDRARSDSNANRGKF